MEEVGRTGRPFFVDEKRLTESITRLAGDSQLVASDSPHFRNRLTHTLHVAELAEEICSMMGMDQDSIDLARTIALAHDSGHAPFSHEAEEVFNRKLKPYGISWDHGMFGVEYLTRFAQSGITSTGLPITIATMEGAVKLHHNHQGTPESAPAVVKMLEAEKGYFHMKEWAPIEGQIVAAADWTAITISDIRDLLKEKLANLEQPNHRSQIQTQLDHEKELREQFDKICNALPLARKVYEEMLRETRDSIKDEDGHRKYFIHQDYYRRMDGFIEYFCQELEKALLTDLLDETLTRYQKNRSFIKNAEDVRSLETLSCEFSDAIKKQLLEGFYEYQRTEVFPSIQKNHIDVIKAMERFFDIVKDSFDGKDTTSFEVDPLWKQVYAAVGEEGEKIKMVAEYISANFSERDVHYYLKEHDPTTYKQLTRNAQDAVHMTVNHPKQISRLSYATERDVFRPSFAH